MRYNHFDMLPERAFLKVGGRVTLEGGGGGSPSPTPQQVTTTTSNIPDWLQGPTQAMVARGEALSKAPYQAYTGQKIAGFSPAQQAAFQQIYGLTEPGEYTQAGQTIGGATQFGAAGAQQAMNFGAGQFAPAGTFGTAEAQQYMSPYQQAVTDITKREAMGEAQMLNRQLAGQAAKAGAFGGSRFGVEQALLGSKLATNLSDIQTKGLQDAYLNAQQQYERDRAARMTTAQQQEAARQAAAGINLQGAQFGAQTGLTAASQLANLGTARQTSDLQRIQALSAAGEQQQALEQQKLTDAYNTYLEKRDWNKNQLGYLSGLIRGTPFSTTQTQGVQTAAPSSTSQLLGLGVTGLGLAQLLKG